jgi:hypothetical protein
LIQPINDLAVAATIIDQALHLIATIAAAFLTGDAQHFELADEIAEDDCAVAGALNHHKKQEPCDVAGH